MAPVSRRTRRRRDNPRACCHTAGLGLPHTLRDSLAVALERDERAGAQGALALSFCVRATPPYVTGTHGSDCRQHRSKAARDSSAPSVHRCGALCGMSRPLGPLFTRPQAAHQVSHKRLSTRGEARSRRCMPQGTASLSRVVQVHRPTLSAATPPRSARTVRRARALRRSASPSRSSQTTVRAPGSLTASWVVRRSCEPVTLPSDCCERLP